MDEILLNDHSNESHWVVLSGGTVYFAVEGNSNFLSSRCVSTVGKHSNHLKQKLLRRIHFWCQLFTMLGSKSCSVDQTLIFKTISYLLFANCNKIFILINNEIYYCCIEGVLKAVENVNKVIGPALIEKVQVNHVHIVLL